MTQAIERNKEAYIYITVSHLTEYKNSIFQVTVIDLNYLMRSLSDRL